MSKKTPVKIAVAGCGYWGKNLVRNYAQLGALAAVVDADAALTAKLSKEFNVAASSWGDVLKDASIDAVAIATPASSHYALAREALEAGKHVFVEKPLSLKVEEAEVLCEVAERVGRRLMVGHLLQYHPAFLELKRMVEEGKLGKLQYVYSNRLNFGKVRTEEDILWSFAPHDISMILALIGSDPYRVRALGSYHLHDSIADVTTTHLSFADGVRAHVFVSWLHPCKEQKLIVVGDAGMAVFDDTQPWASKLLLYPHKIDWCNGIPVAAKADMTPVKLTEDEPLKCESQHFIDCIQTGDRPRTDGYEGLRVLKVLDHAARSLSMELERSKPAVAQKFTVHESAYVDDGAQVGEGTKIWHFSHILPRTTIGKNVVISQNVMAGPDVTIGDNCKIQNNVSLYKGVVLERGVFCGPSCVFTNVNTPRAEVERKDEFLPTIVREGATIGANATIVCGNELGAYCLIAAGAVVTSKVPAHALMAGVPARRIGWVSHTGERLGDDLVCPRTGRQYKQISEHELVAADEYDTVYRFRGAKSSAG